MDRFQTVNGDKGTIAMHPTGPVDLKPAGLDDSEAASGAVSGAFAGATGDFGTCLFLGARGERCSRNALASGFCAKHFSVGEPDQTAEDPRRRSLKVLISVLGLIFLLGPVLVDAARAFLAMLRNN